MPRFTAKMMMVFSDARNVAINHPPVNPPGIGPLASDTFIALWNTPPTVGYRFGLPADGVTLHAPGVRRPAE